MDINDTLEIIYPPEPPMGAEVRGTYSSFLFKRFDFGWYAMKNGVWDSPPLRWENLVEKEKSLTIETLPLLVGGKVYGAKAVAVLPIGTVLLLKDDDKGWTYTKVGDNRWIRYAPTLPVGVFADRNVGNMGSTEYVIGFLPTEGRGR